MHHSRLLTALVALGLLAGCGAEESELDSTGENQGENVAEVDQAVINAYGTIFNTGGTNLNVRSTPSTSGAVVTSIPEGTQVGIECQTTGTTVEGTNIWDFLPSYGGYVTDAYVNTGYDGTIPGVPQCGGGGGSGTLGATIIAKARAQLNYTEYNGNCNKFSAYWGWDCVEWCSDYARYIWMQAGAKTTGLTQSSISFYNYGVNNGTFKSNVAGVVVKPGDAVVWANSTGWGEHVGLVTDVSGSTFRTIHGNFDIQGNGTGDDKVYETGYVDRFYQAGTGAPILGFISPVKL
jgi:plastocyanin